MRIPTKIYNSRSEIAEQISSLKRNSYKQQLQSTFGPILRQRIGQQRLDQLIDDFLNQRLQPLANAPVDTVARALQGSKAAQEELITHVINVQFKKILVQQTTTIQQQLSAHEQLEREIKQTGFQPQSPEIELADKCLWVPASLKHNSPSVAGNRHTFFCYGGVSVQPTIRQVNQVAMSARSQPLSRGGGYGGGSAGGSSSGGGGGCRPGTTHRDAMLRQAGFQYHHIVSPTNKYTKNHQLFNLAGINPDSRTNRIYLPTRPDLHPTRSLHKGKHVNAYSQEAAERMNDIVLRGKMAGGINSNMRRNLGI